MHLKYFVDLGWIESLIFLGLLEDVTSYDSLKDDQLRSYLDSKAEESKETITLDELD